MTENVQIDNLDGKILDIITKNAGFLTLRLRANAMFGVPPYMKSATHTGGVLKGSEFKVNPVLVASKPVPI